MQRAINKHLKDRINLLSSTLDWSTLVSNPHITWDIVNDYPDKPWNLSDLDDLNRRRDVVLYNPDKKWYWYALSIVPSVTHETLQDNIDKEWIWYALSRNPNITWDIIKDNLDKPWNWYYLGKNKAITLDIVKDNPNIQWRWSTLSMNPNILMTPQERSEIVKVVKVKIIQHYWRVCIANPSYTMCRRRLLYEYESELYIW